MSILIAYHKDDKNKRIHITSYTDEHKGMLLCPDGHPVVGKKGTKVIWHYAHVHASDAENDSCCRVMGEWHHWWQGRVEPDFLEIIIKRDGKKHIADMINSQNLVVEFQKSVISPEIIRERETFYKNMIWIFCCNDMTHKIIKTHGRYMKIKLLGGSKYFLSAKKRSFLDFDRRGVLELLKVKNAGKSKPEIYVRIWTMTEFDDEFMKDCLTDEAPRRIDREPYQFKESEEEFDQIEKILNEK
jgi:hypothetical protein